jgi:hypothetical protein
MNGKIKLPLKKLIGPKEFGEIKQPLNFLWRRD